MKLRRWAAAGIGAGLFTVLTGCVASGGYGGEVAVYGPDYYEPYGYEYGHWHSGYHVAPPRREAERERTGRAENRESKPAYRPAPSSRPAPSIPSRSRPHHSH